MSETSVRFFPFSPGLALAYTEMALWPCSVLCLHLSTNNVSVGSLHIIYLHFVKYPRINADSITNIKTKTKQKQYKQKTGICTQNETIMVINRPQ